MQRCLVGCGLLLACLAVSTPALAGRERLRMDGNWRFYRGDFETMMTGTPVTEWRWKADDRGEAAAGEMAAPDLDDSSWQPAGINQDVFGGRRGFAWFRTRLPDVAGKTRRLYFGSVDDDAWVYLNGKLVGRHHGWSEDFDVSLDAAWRDGGPNVVAVLVENSGGGPGGLYKRVLLQADADAVARGPAAPDFDESGWRRIDLPHDFVVEGTFDPSADRNHGYLPVGVAWYRKEFSLPASDRGRRIWLEFDGIYRASTIWLNGKLLGRHQSGYTSFYFDVTDVANFGGRNVLAVRVDATGFEGWWYEGGGIYRHVWLTKLAPVHVGHWGTYVVSEVLGDDGHADEARLNITTTVANDGPSPASGDLVSEVIAPSGKRVAMVQSPFSLKGRESREIGQSAHLLKPALWSIETPNLYRLRSTINIGGKPVDQTETTFGIRTIRFDPDRGFFLNGKPVKIKGTCNHQDFAGVGIALPDRCHVFKIEKLKEMGSNAYRCAHHPHATEILDACDRLGMLVMDENRRLGDSEEILGQVESMVLRDRNHPSVIMWSMCNEEWAYQGTERGAQMFLAMKEVVLRHDKTRPVTCAMNGGFGQGISLVEDLQGFNYNVDAYDKFRAAFPLKPCFGSETASHVSDRGVYQEDREGGYCPAYWGNPEPSWRPIAEREWMAGSFVWTGFDYRGEPSPYNWPCISSHFGILDTCGFPKDSYWYYKAWWKNEPIVHVFPHWNLAGREGQEIPVWCYGNTEKVELIVNGKSFGVRDMPRWSHVEWKVPYEPGVLEVRGYNAGKLVASERIETTGPPAKLQLSPDRTQILADNQDVAMVAVSVLDAAGRVVPTANNVVTFRVEGPGRILGVGNGDPSCHEPDKASRRSAFNGHCLVIVQAADKPGTIRLLARSPGLETASVVIKSTGGDIPWL